MIVGNKIIAADAVGSVVACSDGFGVKFYDVIDQGFRQHLTVHLKGITCVRFLGRGTVLLGDENGRIRVLSMKDYRIRHTINVQSRVLALCETKEGFGFGTDTGLVGALDRDIVRRGNTAASRVCFLEAFGDNELLCIHENQKVVKYDDETFEILKEQIVTGVTTGALMDDLFFCATSRKIILWEAHGLVKLREILTNKPVCGLNAYESTLFVSASNVEVWKRNDLNIRFEGVFKERMPVRSVMQAEDKLVFLGEDTIVKRDFAHSHYAPHNQDGEETAEQD